MYAQRRPAPEFDSSGPCRGKASFHALDENRVLKLRDRAKHIEKQGTRGVARRRVDPLPWHDQGDLVRGELTEQLHKVTQAAAKAIQIVAKDNVDLPARTAFMS